MSRLLRYAAATTVAATTTLIFAGHASAHSNTVACQDQVTSTWRITNDFPLAESFTSPQGPSGTVAAGNGSYTDVVYVGDTLTVTGTWTDGFVGTTTGTGDCTPEGGTTTTTELVTTTTEQETTTSSTTTTAASTSTTAPSTTTLPGTSSTTLPTTSSSVATTSTTSVVPSSSAPSTSTPSTPPPAPSSTTPECSDNPNTPTDDCAPICIPVTLEDGSNSCTPPLPATGSNTVGIIIVAWICVCAGIVALGYGAAHGRR